MARYKCNLCGDWISKGQESMDFKGHKVHVTCFNLSLKQTAKKKSEKVKNKSEDKRVSQCTVKPKIELKDPLSEEDYQEKKAYYEYIRRMIDDSVIPAKIYAMTESIMKKYDVSFKVMLSTLIYMREIAELELGNSAEKHIGYIPYNLDDAKNFYESVKQVEESNKGIDTTTMYQEKVIHILPKKRVVKQINIEEI